VKTRDLFDGLTTPASAGVVAPPPTTDFTKRARRADRDTSKAAAASMEPVGHAHQRIILDTLRRIGPATFYEIAAASVRTATPLTPQQVWRRLSELEERKLITPLVVDDVTVTRKGDSGRACTVWMVL